MPMANRYNPHWYRLNLYCTALLYFHLLCANVQSNVDIARLHQGDFRRKESPMHASTNAFRLDACMIASS